jgi:hypothetical protein
LDAAVFVGSAGAFEAAPAVGPLAGSLEAALAGDGLAAGPLGAGLPAEGCAGPGGVVPFAAFG